MSSAKYKSVALDDGRIAYDVAGMVRTFSEQEAQDLTQTGVFQLSDELTRSLLRGPAHQYTTEVVVEDVAGVKVRQSKVTLVKG